MEDQATDPANDTRQGKLNDRDKTENKKPNRIDRSRENIF